MKKKIIGFLLILATFLVTGLVSADTLNESDVEHVANLPMEAIVPEKVMVKIVMTGGSFKVGNQTYKDQTTIELPYASDLTILPVDAQLTNADLDFLTVIPAYHLEATLLQVTKIRTDGTVTLTYQKTAGQPELTQEPTSTLPKMSDTDRVWVTLFGLGLLIVLSLLVLGRKRHRSD
ncbi:hypothetical protein RyT2_01400 [Pseudolactococcus yaeyamensis]